MIVNVPRAFTIGLTPMLVNRLSVAVPESGGSPQPAPAVDVTAAAPAEIGATAATAERMPDCFRRSRLDQRAVRKRFILVRLFFQIPYSVGQIPGERNRHYFLANLRNSPRFSSGSA